MNEKEIVQLIDYLAANPDVGDEIVGTGGCREVRVAGRGKGKAEAIGSSRFSPDRHSRCFCSMPIPRPLETVWMASNATAFGSLPRKSLRPMGGKSRCGVCDEEAQERDRVRGHHGGSQGGPRLCAGEADLSQYKVHIPKDLDVKAIRKGTGLTQEAFALRYGFNLGRLRDLEQKRTVRIRSCGPICW